MTSAISEHGLIAKYFAPLAAPGGLSLLDDAACLVPKAGYELVVTVDAVVANVHFLASDSPRDIAFKALGVNVSDLAAKGADPVGFLLTLGLEDNWRPEWVEEFSKGLAEAALDWNCPLYGGDTVRANGAPFLSVTAFGETPVGKMVKRGTARVGDRLCISGTIGDGALGLSVALGDKSGWISALDEDEKAFLLGRYRRPQPRVELAATIRRFATAAMDVSDGLVGDLEKLLFASGVSAEVDLDLVPLSPAGITALKADEMCFERLVTGGDDYEILFAIDPGSMTAASIAAAAAGCVIHDIGAIVASGPRPLFRYKGKERCFSQSSFSHF